MLHHGGPGQLVQRDAMTAWRLEGAARTHWNLQALLLLPPLGLERGERFGQVGHPVDEDRAVTFQVVGEQHVRRTGAEPDHGYARPHRIDAECERPTKDLSEIAHVGGHILAWGVDVVELQKWRGRLFTHHKSLVNLQALPGG